MTRIESARKGIITEEIKECAISEGIEPEQLSADISAGITVIPVNRIHPIKPIALGRGLSTKVNANIGTSKDRVSLDDEIEKLEILVKYGADIHASSGAADDGSNRPIDYARNARQHAVVAYLESCEAATD